MALNLNCIDFDLNKPATCVIDTDTGPVIRFWVPYMGWYYAKAVLPENSVGGTPEYTPSFPCDPTPLKTLIDIL